MEAREPNNDEVVINEQNDQEQQKNVKIETPNPQPNQTGVGVFFCMVTLIGTRMGGGIVGIPYATQQIGFLATLFLQFGTIIVGIFAIWLLLKVREITGESSLSNIGYFCYGRISIFFINTMIAIGQLGFPIIFFIVFGDVAGGLIEKVNTSGISFWSSRWFTHTILAIAMFYLVLKKKKFTS